MVSIGGGRDTLFATGGAEEEALFGIPAETPVQANERVVTGQTVAK